MKEPSRTRRIVVGITGASGAAYATRLVQCLLDGEVDVHLVVSKHGRQLLAEELNIRELSAEALADRTTNRFTLHTVNDVGSVISSGSFKTDGMAICPCSSQTLGAIASGLGENLIHRAAHVTMKEMRRLVLVTREMPMSRIDLLNALRLCESGAVICPAAPGFYMKPRSVQDLVDFVVGKVLDLLNVAHSLNVRWEDQRESSGEEARP